MIMDENIDHSKLQDFAIYPEGDDSTDGPASLCYIYIISEAINGQSITNFYKVGETGNLHQRLLELQSGNPRQLCYHSIVTVVVSDKHAAERAAHEAVAAYRTTDGGGREWYYVETQNLDTFTSLVKAAVSPYIIS